MAFPPASLVFLPPSNGSPAKTCVDAGGDDEYSGWRCMLLVLRCLSRTESVLTVFGLPRDHYDLMYLVRAGRPQTGDATDEEFRVFSALVGSLIARSGTVSIFDHLSFERVRAWRKWEASVSEPPCRWAINVSDGDRNMEIVQAVFSADKLPFYEEKPAAWALPILLQQEFEVARVRAEGFSDFAAVRRLAQRDPGPA